MVGTRARIESGGRRRGCYGVRPGGAVGGPTTGPPSSGGGSEELGRIGFVGPDGGLGTMGLQGKQLSIKPAMGALLHPARNATTTSATTRFMPGK
jgi:hypothetical protein